MVKFPISQNAAVLVLYTKHDKLKRSVNGDIRMKAGVIYLRCNLVSEFILSRRCQAMCFVADLDTLPVPGSNAFPRACPCFLLARVSGQDKWRF